ncbi:MAG: RnfABCDGE type electron transport complex subunit D [Erysipelotrichaceae bacterium]
MKFTFNASPNLRQRQSTQNIMFELMLGLLVVFAGQLVYYFTQLGQEYAVRAILLMLTAVVTGIVTEIVWCLITKKDFKKFLPSSFPLITSIILAMMVPVNTTYYALVVGTVFALVFGKLVFGGFGQNIFNPAALGRAVILASFTTAVVSLDAFSGATTTTLIASEFNWLMTDSAVVAAMFDKVGSMWNLFTGMYVGGMGETNTLLIMLVGAVLAYRKVLDWRLPVMYVATVFALTLGVAIFRGVPSYEMFGIFWYPMVHIATGGLMFGAVFMMTDPVTSPTSAAGRVIFAVGAGIITVLIRLLGNYPEGVLFAILLMNMLTPMIERLLDGKQVKTAKKAIIATSAVFLVGLGLTLVGANTMVAATLPEPEPEVVGPLTPESVSGLTAEFIESVDNGDGTTTYTVLAEGFYPEGNTFAITLDADNVITVFKVTKNSDTPEYGGQISKEDFTSQFVGQTISADLEVDAITGTTVSSKSAARALLEVVNQLGN